MANGEILIRVKGPHGTEVQATFDDHEVTRVLHEVTSIIKEVELDGRKLLAALERRMAADDNLPNGMKEYPCAMTTIDGRDVHTSGRHTGIEQWLDLGGGYGARVEVRPAVDEVRPPHPADKECGDCRIWDRQAAADMIKESEWHFDNGDLSQLTETIKAEAALRGGPPLTPTNMGWCYKCKGIQARNAPACVEHFVEQPHV